jgi:hypothetical protein
MSNNNRPPHESPEYRYGALAVDERCLAPVEEGEVAHLNHDSFFYTRRGAFRQCSRKRGYGYNGLYCKQHSKRWPA